ALRRSKRETTIHQADGSSEEADFESEVPDEPKGNGDEANVQDDEEVQDSDDEPQYVDDERTDYENQETNDDEEETEDEELYGDVNVSLTDAEPDDEDKGDKEMTNADTEDAEHKNVIQESACNQVKDDAQATQKTEGDSENVADIIKEHFVPFETMEILRQQYAPQKKFDQNTTLFEKMTKSKSFNKSPKQRALYHALMESILEDENSMDEGVAEN
ncbi:hypothetical protein Tco_1513749, partial [Tanacetum coccineum]